MEAEYGADEDIQVVPDNACPRCWCPPLEELPTLIEQLDTELRAMCEKYHDLVWYARSSPDCYPDKEDDLRAAVFLNQTAIEAAYPKETGNLGSEDGQWHHGFNSGMLAAARFIGDLLDGNLELAREEFPMLDT